MQRFHFIFEIYRNISDFFVYFENIDHLVPLFPIYFMILNDEFFTL